MSSARKWFLPLVRAESGRLGTLLLLGLAGVGLELLLPWPMKLIIDHVLPGRALPDVAGGLTALPGAGTAQGLLAWLTGTVLLLFLASQGVKLASGLLHADVAARLRLSLGGVVFEALQRLSLSWHRRGRRGDLVRRVTTDTGALPAIATDGLPAAVTSMVLLAGTLAIMWRLDRTLALLAVGVALPMGVLIRLLGPRMATRAYEQQEAEGSLWSVAERTLTAIPVVQAFGAEEHEHGRFTVAANRTVRAYMRALATQVQFTVGVGGLQALGTAAVMLVGGWHAVEGRILPGTLVVFLSYVTALYAPLVTLAYLTSTLATAAGGVRRVLEVLDSGEVIGDEPGARPLRAPATAARGRVTLENVRFGYGGVLALDGIDLDVQPGELLALVGSSGAGKSTLISLIPRLADPWSGRVLIDGQDVRHATLASVREQVALVLQEALLLPVSIADNIAYGRATADGEEIVTAARLAEADEFIRRLPQGYDTRVGERGVTLSGGQRQRLSIARALLRESSILLMDEPTSALDVATEKNLFDSLQRWRRGRTVIVIAHRLSTVRAADRIVVLDRGRIAAIGTHEELRASDPIYQRLYVSQLHNRQLEELGT